MTYEGIKEYLKTHAVNCKTEEEARELLEFLHGKGFEWSNGVSLKRTTYWIVFATETVYSIEDKGFVVGSKDVRTRFGFSTVPFQEFKSKFMEETMNVEKEASKCQEESREEQMRRIALEVYQEQEKSKEVKDNGWKLTQKEINMLKAFHLLGWSWIARDQEDDSLCVYEEKPQREESKTGGKIWAQEKISKRWKRIDNYSFPAYKDEFQFITWEDEPMLIADLIKDHWGNE